MSLTRRLMATSNVDSGSVETIPLPTAGVESPPVADQSFEVDMIAGLYQRIAFQQDLVESYRDLKQAMRKQTLRGNQLEQELRSSAESASMFVTFVQVRHDRHLLDLEYALAEGALLWEEVFAGQCQEQQIDDLKSKLLKTTPIAS